MARYNGSFKYKTTTPGQKDPDTGFFAEGVDSDWLDGGPCHVEKHIPPKEIKGMDGTVTRYEYEIFLPLSSLNLSAGTPLALFGEDGIQIDSVQVIGFDRTGRKNIVVWA